MRNIPLSIVLPVFNEEENIEKVLKSIFDFTPLVANDFEIVVVDDGSRDSTDKILKILANNNPHLKVITHYKNLGYGSALFSGVKACQYPLIFLMDADRQFNISEIMKLLPYIGQSDIVIGSRLLRRDQLYRIIMGKVYNLLICVLFKIKIKDITCGFKLIKRTIFNKIELKSRGGFINAEILIKAKMLGYSIKEVAISHFPRRGGRQTGASLKAIKMKLLDLFRLWRGIQR